jgi:hypothetical protein
MRITATGRGADSTRCLTGCDTASKEDNSRDWPGSHGCAFHGRHARA